MNRALLLLGALLGGVVAGCEAAPVAPPAPDAEQPVRFADGGGALPDGTVLYRDAAPDAEPPLPACRFGSAIGTVCAPDGDTPIAEAEITAAARDCEGNPVNLVTRSDGRGRFRLDGMAPGLTRVTVRTGGFVAHFDVEVIGGVEVPVGQSSKVCLDSAASRLAVLSGSYDRVEGLLDDLGFEYDLHCGAAGNAEGARALLGDPERLAGYRVVFANCASGLDLALDNPEVEALVENLRAFVRNGGSVYASDLAGDLVARAWPAHVDIALHTPPQETADVCCVCVTDCPARCAPVESIEPLCPERPPECPPGRGVSGQGSPGTVAARVRSAFLRNYLDSDRMQVVFNLGGWAEIAEVAHHVEVLVADEGGRPLMVLFEPEPGGGRVAYTSFHTHAQATRQMEAILRALVFRL